MIKNSVTKKHLKQSLLISLFLFPTIGAQAANIPTPITITFNAPASPPEFSEVRWNYGFQCDNVGGASYLVLENQRKYHISCKGTTYGSFQGVAKLPDYVDFALYQAGDEELIKQIGFEEPSRPLCSLTQVTQNATVNIEYDPVYTKSNHRLSGYYVYCNVENN